MFLHILTDILRNSILVTGLVVIMMMLIESVDIESHGRFFSRLKKNSLPRLRCLSHNHLSKWCSRLNGCAKRQEGYCWSRMSGCF